MRKNFVSDEITTQVIENLIRNNKYDLTLFPELEQEIRNNLSPDGAKNTHLSALLHHHNYPEKSLQTVAIEKFKKMDFDVLEAPEGSFFFTSDNPGFSLVGNTIRNTDWDSMNAVMFPINSRQAVRFKKMNKYDVMKYVSYKKITHGQISMINRATISSADEFIFCENFKYLRKFIETFPSE